MCNFSVDLDAHAAEAGCSDGSGFAAEVAALAPLQADGMVKIFGRRIVVTDAGRPFVRLVAAVFDAYLQRGEARYSPAV